MKEQDKEEEKNEPIEKKWRTVTDLLKTVDDTEPWLVEPFIRKVGLTMLAGPSDTGKSTLLRQLALSVATRQATFLGSKLNVNHGKVCYICTEDDSVSTSEVLRKQIKGLGLTDTIDTLAFNYECENLEQDLTDYLKSTNVDLIVVDGFADTFTGNPNSLTDVRKSLNKLHAIAVKNGCAIVLIHHNVKGSEKSTPNKNMVNGSQAFEAKCRSVLDFRNGTSIDERVLTITKANSLPRAEKQKSHILKLDNEHLLFTPTGTETIAASNGVKQSKYDAVLWISRMQEYKEKYGSYDAARKKLVKDFEEDEVPSKAWFVEKMNVSDSQTKSPDKEPDQPKEEEQLLTKKTEQDDKQ